MMRFRRLSTIARLRTGQDLRPRRRGGGARGCPNLAEWPRRADAARSRVRAGRTVRSIPSRCRSLSSRLRRICDGVVSRIGYGVDGTRSSGRAPSRQRSPAPFLATMARLAPRPAVPLTKPWAGRLSASRSVIESSRRHRWRPHGTGSSGPAAVVRPLDEVSISRASGRPWTSVLRALGGPVDLDRHPSKGPILGSRTEHFPCVS
jgi:hypothetical protein